MILLDREHLAFDDVLLRPSYTEIRSRLEPNTSTLVAGIRLNAPIISSPMDTVTESDMAIAMSKAGGMGIIHRFMSSEEQILQLRRVARSGSHQTSGFPDGYPVVPAVGVGKAERERVSQILRGVKPYTISAIAIDIANGHSILMKEMIDFVNQETGGLIPIIAGNVATGDGFLYLAEAGAKAVRVGIGGGSICKTRIMTGAGMPTLESIVDCYSAKLKGKSLCSDVAIIADGGIRYPADLVKSICAGADAIIGGRMFSATDETPGEYYNLDGSLADDKSEGKYKVYRGMASSEVQADKKGGLKSGTCAEGVSTFIKSNGSACDVVDRFSAGLRSGMSYANASSLHQLRDNSVLIKITKAGIEESHAFGTKNRSN